MDLTWAVEQNEKKRRRKIDKTAHHKHKQILRQVPRLIFIFFALHSFVLFFFCSCFIQPFVIHNAQTEHFHFVVSLWTASCWCFIFVYCFSLFSLLAKLESHWNFSKWRHQIKLLFDFESTSGSAAFFLFCSVVADICYFVIVVSTAALVGSRNKNGISFSPLCTI